MKLKGLTWLLILGFCDAGVAEAGILDGPPMVSATSWVVADAGSGEILFSKNMDQRRQIASLTKMMTALVVFDYVDADRALLEATMSVSHRAAIIHGTNAGLEAGEVLSINDLLYALLLPSGNDAAVMLAEFFGRRMVGQEGVEITARFLRAMNQKAESYGMSDTTFVDVHGMGANESTARDLLQLVRVAMTNGLFQEIVATREYSVEVRSNRGRVRTVHWQNTNTLLGEFNGVKTGHTNTAGGCLALSGTGEHPLHVVVLESDNKDTRFMDAYNLYQWALFRLMQKGDH